MKKKLLSMLLVLVMVVCVFPASAFAYNAGSASSTSPWYGECSGSGVRIRQSASTSSNILGQIDKYQPIEIIGVPNTSWYKVRYNENGDIGYIYSQYLAVRKTTYGRVLGITGVDMEKGINGEYITHVAYNNYMPYYSLYYYNDNPWAYCVFGMTTGYVDTVSNACFNFQPI